MPDAKIFESVTRGAGLFNRSDRRRLEVTGADRAKFLNNLVTNEVKRLPVGKGCEAFVTSPQGRIIAYVIVSVAEDSIMLRTDSGGADALLPHLAKYGVFDEVTIENLSDSTFEYHMAGPAAEEIVRRCLGVLPEITDLAHVQAALGAEPIRVIRESPAGIPGLSLLGDVHSFLALKASLLSAGTSLGLVEAPDEVFEVLRIEAGTPVFGQDVTDKNLPQEIGRDSRAINFVKGCYLGQETVARLDALGHVNQILKGLVFEPGSPCPDPGSALEAEGKKAGVLTSCAYSPVRNGPVALAMIRTSHMAPGTIVHAPAPAPASGSPIGAMVCDLPFLPPELDRPRP